MDEFTKIKQKIEDYSRFLITLIILSVYFYLGMIITTFLEPSEHSNILIVLLLGSTALAGWFAYLLQQWKKQLNDSLND